MSKTTFNHSGGERKYRIKKDGLKNLDNSSSGITQFEKHLIQESVKQVLFAQGSEETEVIIKKGEDVTWTGFQKIVPKEVIRFLLDYDIIEEFKL